MKLAKAGLLGALVLSVALAGCLGGAPPAPPPTPPRANQLDDDEFRRLELLAAPEIRNYTLPGSQLLEPKVKWFNDTIGPEANAALQDRNMRGGNDFGTVLKTFPIDDLLPAGQPTALRITLTYFGSPGSAAKAHIYVCVPGTCTYYTTNNNDQFNWKATVETLSVATIGVTGEPALVGVAAANGLVANGNLPFALSVEASYFQDVLTPFHAYAFNVPQGATGITLSSVKPGQEHLQAKFVILDPNDELVAYTEYDDIAIVSESIFIPTRQPGEYVFYAQEMHNGFFRIVSDAPLGNDTALRVLPVTRTETPIGSTPAPGLPERDFLGGAAPAPVVTPYQEGSKVSFNIEGFPLEVGAYIGDGVTSAAEVRILSSKGMVYKLQRLARVDTEQGSLGYTRDESNSVADWSMLAPGAYSISLVYNGGSAEAGYWVKTFQR